MADNLSVALAELVRKADAEPDVDTLREGVRVMTQALMELEVAQHLVRNATSGVPIGKVNALATAIEGGIPVWARSSYAFPASVMAVSSFQGCWSPASERNERWWRLCAKRHP